MLPAANCHLVEGAAEPARAGMCRIRDERGSDPSTYSQTGAREEEQKLLEKFIDFDRKNVSLPRRHRLYPDPTGQFHRWVDWMILAALRHHVSAARFLLAVTVIWR